MRHLLTCLRSIKTAFSDFYSEVIRKGLVSRKNVDDIKVDLLTSVLKPKKVDQEHGKVFDDTEGFN